MSTHQNTLDSSNGSNLESHTNWLNQVKLEFQYLLAEQEMEFSPCSSKRNSKRIWLNDMRQTPLLERQKGYSNISNIGI